MTSRPDSPCLGVCSTTYTEVCNGCGRHFLEVSAWNGMTDEQKDTIWNRLQKEGWVDGNFKPLGKAMR